MASATQKQAPADDGSAPTRLSPAAGRRRLGAELRSLRKNANLTLSQAGKALQRSQATMSRIEVGSTPTRAVDIQRLLDVYRDAGAQVDDSHRQQLLELVDVGRETEWFSSFRDVIAGDMTGEHVATYISYETYAEHIVNFEPEIVPGLLQTSAYARAVVDAFFPNASDYERHRLADLRMERRLAVERQGSPNIDFVITDNALRRTFGGPEVLAEQLQTLVWEIRGGTPNFGVRILPGTSPIPAALGGPFVVMTFSDEVDRPVVYLESRTGERYLYDDTAVADYQLQFASLVDETYTDTRAVELLEEAAKQIG